MVKPKVRRCTRRRPHAKVWKKMVLLQSFTYLGFKVELWNNKAWSFRYEWKLRPITKTALHLTKRDGKFHKVIHDPTSMPTRKGAMLYAKQAVEYCYPAQTPWRWNVS